MFIISAKLFSVNEKSLRNIKISPNARRLANYLIFILHLPAEVKA